MLDRIRELERLLESDQNDYLSALRERIYPIKGKISLGADLLTTVGEDRGDTFIYEYQSGDGIVLPHDSFVENLTEYFWRNEHRDGDGDGFGYGLIDGDGVELNA